MQPRESHRTAIAMIELIFSIVVMGIVMMSAPQLIRVATDSTTVALQQEAINEASSRVNMILTYPWDSGDTNDSCIPPVLQVANGAPALDEDNHRGRRVGVPDTSTSHSFLCGNRRIAATTPLSSYTPQTTPQVIEDFKNSSGSLQLQGVSSTVDYIETSTVQIATAITYAPDTFNYTNQTIQANYTPGNSGGSTNIKGIAVTLTSTNTAQELSDKNITMQAFSCNIGGYEYAKRTFC